MIKRGYISRHVASGILENASQEAEKFEKWWRGSIPVFQLVYNLRYKIPGRIYISANVSYFYNVNYTLIEMLGSGPSTIFKISPPPVKHFPKFRMLRDGKCILSLHFRALIGRIIAPTSRQKKRLPRVTSEDLPIAE